MSTLEQINPVRGFGSGDFQFGEWETPFTNAEIEILEVIHSPKRPWPEGVKPHYRAKSPLREHSENDLVVRVYSHDSNKIYRVSFPWISAMRLLDEGGLLEFWQKTSELGGRPGQTTFRVRNHAWTAESFISFISTDGWSFVIASQNECLEVISDNAFIVAEE